MVKCKKGGEILKAKISLICFILSVVFLIGCASNSNKVKDNNYDLEYGFKMEDRENEPLPSTCVAYRSKTIEFNKDNVTLEFFYGTIPHYDIEGQMLANLYFTTSDKTIRNFEDIDSDFVLIKYIEDFTQKKYNLKWDFESSKPLITYNHSENFTIPSSFFTGDKGVIYFRIVVIHRVENVESYGDNPKIPIYYKCENSEKIVLSSTEFI